MRKQENFDIHPRTVLKIFGSEKDHSGGDFIKKEKLLVYTYTYDYDSFVNDFLSNQQ